MTAIGPCIAFGRALLLFLLALATVSAVSAGTTAFSYQGQLQQNGAMANGIYNFQFSLYANSSGGSAFAGPTVVTGVGVTNGLFTTTVDFGAAFNGAVTWLQVAVETNGGSSFTPLSPRSYLSPSPMAIYAESVNPAGISNVNISTATGILPAATLPLSVVTNGAASLNVNSFTATNYGYVGRWVTNSYSISTNDTLLFCWGTNELLTLPTSAPIGKMFTIFSKNPNGSVILTNGNGSQLITAPGLGQNLAVALGASTSPSNVITVTFDGYNY